MVIFHSYVSLPEGKPTVGWINLGRDWTRSRPMTWGRPYCNTKPIAARKAWKANCYMRPHTNNNIIYIYVNYIFIYIRTIYIYLYHYISVWVCVLHNLHISPYIYHICHVSNRRCTNPPSNVDRNRPLSVGRQTPPERHRCPNTWLGFKRGHQPKSKNIKKKKKRMM